MDLFDIIRDSTNIITPPSSEDFRILDRFLGNSSTGDWDTDTGQTWIPTIGVYEKNQGVCYPLTQVSLSSMMLLESFLSDCTISLTLLCPTNNFNTSIIARYVDSANYLKFQVEGSYVKVIKVVAGVSTQVGFFNESNAGTHMYTVVLSGSSVKVLKDGVKKLTYTIADNLTGTKVGIQDYYATNKALYKFEVSPYIMQSFTFNGIDNYIDTGIIPVNTTSMARYGKWASNQATAISGCRDAWRVNCLHMGREGASGASWGCGYINSSTSNSLADENFHKMALNENTSRKGDLYIDDAGKLYIDTAETLTTTLTILWGALNTGNVGITYHENYLMNWLEIVHNGDTYRWIAENNQVSKYLNGVYVGPEFVNGVVLTSQFALL